MIETENWPAHTHTAVVCRLQCVDVVWELFSGLGFDFP